MAVSKVQVTAFVINHAAPGRQSPSRQAWRLAEFAERLHLLSKALCGAAVLDCWTLVFAGGSLRMSVSVESHQNNA